MRCKYLILTILSLLSGLVVRAQQLSDIEITVQVQRDGSAIVTQIWDVQVSSGTEWYIPIGNLGKMTVSDLHVWENGHEFASDGDKWNSKRDIFEKRGRCGIVRKRNGVELCWGQGSYGKHKWTASFRLGGLVQAMKDYDGFNFMFVNPELSAAPRHVRVCIENEGGGEAWTSDNVKVWGFGFSGNIHVSGGRIVAESSQALSRKSSVIIMARFDKGLLAPSVSNNIPFSKMEKKAKRGSDYSSKGNDGDWKSLLLLILTGAGLVWLVITRALGYKYKASLFGTRKIDGWWREVPLGGNIFAAYYALEKGSTSLILSAGNEKHLIGAFFLKWILEKKAVVRTDPKHPKRFSLALRTDVGFEDRTEMSLYEMALAAAGDNRILEPKEFEKWSKRNFQHVYEWPDRALKRGRRYLISKGLLAENNKATTSGQEELRHVIQFKNYLSDFTITDQRGLSEVALWKDFLVFGQLYGIAEKVCDQLKKLFPADFEAYARELDMDTTLFMTTVGNSISMTEAAYSASSSEANREGGGGGSTSSGGGGGFSGGGSGGGSR